VIDLQSDRPHPARVYDDLLGGKNNFAADRAAAEAGPMANPNSLIPPRQNRAFMRRGSCMSITIPSCSRKLERP
jgi:hypothetical protein